MERYYIGFVSYLGCSSISENLRLRTRSVNQAEILPMKTLAPCSRSIWKKGTVEVFGMVKGIPSIAHIVLDLVDGISREGKAAKKEIREHDKPGRRVYLCY